MPPRAQDPFFPSIGSVAAAESAREPSTETNDTNMFDGDEDDRAVQEIESLCMSCHENGTTRLLLTSIPYFREVVVMSFRCEHCGEANTEIQSAGMIQERGSTYTVHVRNPDDLSRQLVKSPTATITIPEFSLTIPPGKGQLTNVEGVVRDTYRDLELDQPVRKVMDPDTWAKIEALLTQLRAAVGDAVEEEGARTWEGRNRGELGEDGEGRPEQGDEKRRRTSDAVAPAAAAAPTAAETAFVPFTITVDDPSGNSFLAFHETISDPKWALRTYVRSRAQDEGLGLVAPAADGGPPEEEYVDRGEGRFENEEIYSFPSTCSSCQGALDTLMKKVNIPYFQDIIIMSTNCQSCGYKDNEVKSGGAVSAQGKRIVLQVEDAEDLSRDLLKSETCGLEIPEIELVLQPGTLGGRFTTLEGILTQVYDELNEKVFASGGAGGGDSRKGGGAGGGEEVQMGGFEKFLLGLKAVMNAERPFTLILDDPLANSYLQNPYAPDPDPAMTFELYDRTFDQNDELGLNDMVVEGYEGEKEAQEASAEADRVAAAAAAAESTTA